MQKLPFTTKDNRKFYKVTDEVCDEMFAKAKEAMQYCYPTPHQGFAVSVLTSKGNIYAGANYNSETYTLTMHSEAVALAHAANHGETEIVAITGPNCHICKQLIWESSIHSGIEIQVLVKEDGQTKKISISELMPYPWPDKNGNI